jgi:hypothetical protein
MKTHLLILSILFLTPDLHAQVKAKTNMALLKNNFIEFKDYCHRISKQKGLNAHCEYSREITNKFQEAVFYIENNVPIKGNSSIFTVYTYRVALITYGKEIVHYNFTEKKNKQINGDWVPYLATIKVYSNKRKMQVLKEDFKKMYSTDFNEDELFTEGIVYGEGCGFAVQDPEERIQLNSFVTNMDTTSLKVWLGSTNTEKQVYAVDGFFQLKKKGLKLTDYEIRLINFIKSKKGDIQTCSGCLYSNETIIEMTKDFVF